MENQKKKGLDDIRCNCNFCGRDMPVMANIGVDMQRESGLILLINFCDFCVAIVEAMGMKVIKRPTFPVAAIKKGETIQ